MLRRYVLVVHTRSQKRRGAYTFATLPNVIASADNSSETGKNLAWESANLNVTNAGVQLLNEDGVSQRLDAVKSLCFGLPFPHQPESFLQ
jgi:hypothetical protein